MRNPLQKNKVSSVRDPVILIRDGDTNATSSFIGIGVPEELFRAIKTQFHGTGFPRRNHGPD